MTSRTARKSAIGATIATIAWAIAVPAMAQDLFEPVQGAVLDKAFISRGSQTNLVTVMIMLSGEPVARVRICFVFCFGLIVEFVSIHSRLQL